MNKLYKSILLLSFLAFALPSFSQECRKTCDVQKEVGDGVFLGVQITSNPRLESTRIIEIIEGTQAETMGLEKGDIIHTINDVQMKDVYFMVEWIGSQEAGMPVTIALTRGKEPMTIKGELGFKEVRTVTETICCDENFGKLELAKLSAYPNPSQGEFMLSFETKSNEPIEMRIVDLNGNLILENTIYPNGGFVNERILANPGVSGDHVLVLSQNGYSTERKLVFVR